MKVVLSWLFLATGSGALTACATTANCGRPEKPILGMDNCWYTSEEQKPSFVRGDGGCMAVYQSNIICIREGKKKCVPVVDEIIVSCDSVPKDD